MQMFLLYFDMNGNDKLSALNLANIEALAQNESGQTRQDCYTSIKEKSKLKSFIVRPVNGLITQQKQLGLVSIQETRDVFQNKNKLGLLNVLNKNLCISPSPYTTYGEGKLKINYEKERDISSCVRYFVDNQL